MMRWLLAHQDHAIERVAITLQFAEPIPSRLLQSILNTATATLPKSGFNSISDDVEINIDTMAPLQAGVGAQIVIGPGGVVNRPGAVQTGIPVGRTFRAVRDSDIREEISIRRDVISYSTANYTRWVNFMDRLRSLLGDNISSCLQSITLNFVKLEYWDRFVFNGNRDDADYSELISQVSPYIPPFSFGMTSLWHSHVGYFEPTDNAKKRLININVDVLDVAEKRRLQQASSLRLDLPQERRSVAIYTMAQDTFAPAMSPATIDGLHSTLDELHAILKVALGKIITREAAARIGLNDGVYQ